MEAGERAAERAMICGLLKRALAKLAIIRAFAWALLRLTPSQAVSLNPKPGGPHIGRRHSPKFALKQKNPLVSLLV